MGLGLELRRHSQNEEFYSVHDSNGLPRYALSPGSILVRMQSSAKRKTALKAMGGTANVDGKKYR
jgi:hypothetical protein